MDKKDKKKVRKRGKAPKIRRPKYVEHKVSDAYREYLKRQRTAAKDEVIDFPKEPFGANRGLDPKYWNRETKKVQNSGKKTDSQFRVRPIGLRYGPTLLHTERIGKHNEI